MAAHTTTGRAREILDDESLAEEVIFSFLINSMILFKDVFPTTLFFLLTINFKWLNFLVSFT
jgi:hypothetical protein